MREPATAYACRLCGGSDAERAIDGIRDWEYGADGVWSYVRCRACGSVQLDPFPELADLERAYPDSYIGHVESAAARGRLYKILFDTKEFFFNRQLRPLVPRGARALDVGCGNGEFLERLRRLGATEVQGIDFSERAVRLAAARDVPVYRGVFLDFEAPPASYDVIVMYNYFEHTLDPVAEATKAHRLLRPGGTLLGELPNFASWDRMLFGRYWGGNHVPRHTFQFDPAGLVRLLRRAGFSDVRVRQEVNPAHLVLSIQNFLQRHAPDLRHNPHAPNGRAPYHAPLMLACLPVNALFALARRSGVMTFFARA